LVTSEIIATFADIQEFYDGTLSNEQKSLDQKTYETQQIAARWENNGGPLAAFRAIQQVACQSLPKTLSAP